MLCKYIHTTYHLLLSHHVPIDFHALTINNHVFSSLSPNGYMMLYGFLMIVYKIL